MVVFGLWFVVCRLWWGGEVQRAATNHILQAANRNSYGPKRAAGEIQRCDRVSDYAIQEGPFARYRRVAKKSAQNAGASALRTGSGGRHRRALFAFAAGASGGGKGGGGGGGGGVGG